MHSIGVLTVESPGAALHQLLVRQRYCAAHNAARFGDIMYLSRPMAHVSTTQCKRYPEMPSYVREADLCTASKHQSTE
eukprot:6557378-Prymnesium_polylepis.2